MKANKFFLGLALIGAILTGCEKDPVQTGDYDTTSYMSVSIAQVGGTRATDGPGTSGGFIVGEDSENLIKSVDFYFFNGDAPFTFGSDVKNGATPGASFGDSNCYTYVPGTTTPGTDGDNVGKIVNSTLVISHNKGNIPTSMVAVINCNAGAYNKKTLTELKAATLAEGTYINEIDGKKCHIMTNSVYRGADGKEAFETPISIANLAINETNAKNNPVTIYVERVAARVKVVQTNSTTNPDIYNTSIGAYKTGAKINIDNAGPEKEVYARIAGWNIVTYANNGLLVKDVEFSDWANASLNGFNWSDPVNYRSYWANANKGDADVTKKFKWNQLTNTIGTTIDYCLENTTTPVYNTLGFDALGASTEDKDISRTNVTKVVVAADLVDASGNPVVFIRWYGQDYSLNGIKTAVANLLKGKYMYSESSVYYDITADDIDVLSYNDYVGGDHQYYYQVYFKLSEATGVGKNRAGGWYTPTEVTDGGGNTTIVMQSVTPDVINTYLYGVKRADYYNGKSYYIVNIKHLGTVEKDASNVYQPAYYGIVRNHAYEIAIESISGLGTPVIDPNEEHEEPITPTDSESYVAAQINILAWHVVNQTVTLQ